MPARGAERPPILSRSEWGAKPADDKLMSKQAPAGIVIHHTSTRQQPKLTLKQKMLGLQGFSRAPGKVGSNAKPAWGDVPYHFYIDVAGQIGEGRDIAFAGDTNTHYDTKNKIQVVVEGNFEREKPAAGQLEALSRLVRWLSGEYKVAADKIVGHNDLAATDCPGKELKPFLAELRKQAAENEAPLEKKAGR